MISEDRDEELREDDLKHEENKYTPINGVDEDDN